MSKAITKISAVLFDMDGVLIDLNNVIEKARIEAGNLVLTPSKPYLDICHWKISNVCKPILCMLRIAPIMIQYSVFHN